MSTAPDAPNVRDVPVANLALDLLNPRLEQQPGQRDAIRSLMSAQGEKVLNLADDIVKEGLDPSSLSIVVPDQDDDSMFVVVEGNRRLTALKILGRPDLVEDLLPTPAAKKLRTLAGEFAKSPIAEVKCVVFDDREEANHWIALRHSGQQGGRGIVEWGGAEAARFEERRGGASRSGPALDAVELVRRKGRLPKSVQDRLGKVPITTVQRLLNDPAVRERLGVRIENGRLFIALAEAEVLKGLTKIIRDAAEGELKVTKIDSKKQREKYLDEFAANELPSATARRYEVPQPAVAVGHGERVAPRTTTPRAQQPSHARLTVVPKTAKLAIPDQKPRNIFSELKRLKIDGPQPFPIAAAVLVRVFLELSVEWFIRKNQLMTAPEIEKRNLKQKMKAVEERLAATQRMPHKHLVNLRRVTDENHFLAASLTTLHAYVHDPHFAPAPSDLRAAWDTLQPFFDTIYSDTE